MGHAVRADMDAVPRLYAAWLLCFALVGCGVEFSASEGSGTPSAGTGGGSAGAGMPSETGPGGAEMTGAGAGTAAGGSGGAASQTGGMAASGGMASGGAGGNPPLGPFGAKVALAALNSPSGEDDPSLTDDMLEIFFDSNRMGNGGDVWTSARANVNDPWPPPTMVGNLSSTDNETTPEISRDGLTIWLSSNRNGPSDIYVATRPSRQDAWSTPVRVSALSSPDGDFATYVSGDQTYLLMGSTRPGVGNFDMFESTRSTTAQPWGIPTIVNVSTASVETDPWFDVTRTRLYFSSDRSGTVGGWDIWSTTRPDPTAAWGAATNVSELNTPDNDGDVWLSPDMRVIFLSHAGDLYMATR